MITTGIAFCFLRSMFSFQRTIGVAILSAALTATFIRYHTRLYDASVFFDFFQRED